MYRGVLVSGYWNRGVPLYPQIPEEMTCDLFNLYSADYTGDVTMNHNICRDSADRERLAISKSELVSMLEVSLQARLLKIESSMEFLSVWNWLEVIESGHWNSPVY